MKITINEILGLLLIIALIIWTYYPLIPILLKKKRFSHYYSVEDNFNKQGFRLILLVIGTIIAGIFLIGWFICEIGTLSLTI